MSAPVSRRCIRIAAGKDKIELPSAEQFRTDIIDPSIDILSAKPKEFFMIQKPRLTGL